MLLTFGSYLVSSYGIGEGRLPTSTPINPIGGIPPTFGSTDCACGCDCTGAGGPPGDAAGGRSMCDFRLTSEPGSWWDVGGCWPVSSRYAVPAAAFELVVFGL